MVIPHVAHTQQPRHPDDQVWKRVIVFGLILFSTLTVLDQTSIHTKILSRLTVYFGVEQANMDYHEDTASQTYVVTTTYYPDISDIRFNIALEMCKLAKYYRIHLIIVDDSPQHTTVREQFQAAGTSEYVRVYKQNRNKYSGKGGALRQSIQEAANLIQQSYTGRGNPLNDAVICFTEPEKVDLFNSMHWIAKPIIDGAADVVIPHRSDELFKQTYPIEQYHSESFGNLHFDLLAKQFPGFQNDRAQKLDWLFGPFAFKASLAKTWLDITSFIVLIVKQVIQRGFEISSGAVTREFELGSLGPDQAIYGYEYSKATYQDMEALTIGSMSRYWRLPLSLK